MPKRSCPGIGMALIAGDYRERVRGRLRGHFAPIQIDPRRQVT